MSAVPQFLSRTDVPQHYPVCQRVVDEWIASDVLPVIRIGRKPILRSIDIDAYLNSLIATKPATRRGRPTKAQQAAKRGNEFRRAA